VGLSDIEWKLPPELQSCAEKELLDRLEWERTHTTFYPWIVFPSRLGDINAERGEYRRSHDCTRFRVSLVVNGKTVYRYGWMPGNGIQWTMHDCRETLANEARILYDEIRGLSPNGVKS